ncbi:MAG TPA: glycosyltransferase [Gaiellaceae bacterium]|nr:glycosyltransferase [Gaiellaceae bacterium]
MAVPPEPSANGTSPRCVWRGDFGSSHSLAVVNDALTAALAAAGGTIDRIRRRDAPSRLNVVGVAGQWPPSFEAPAAGPFVLYQPWEFGRVPRSWLAPIRRTVDEVWTPSEASRRAFVDSGIAEQLVHVVPNGVDLERFSPDGPRTALPTGRSTVFLFVGGTIHRKGIDALLEAYRAAFSADDDVALVVKSFGAKTYYAGQTADALFDAFRAQPGAPELCVLDDEVPYDEMPALYRAADVVVQPYRGEGFCLPALEALACGVPVVVTAGGSTDDFVDDACAWRVPATRTPVPSNAFAAEGIVLAGDGFLLEPDRKALAAALADAAEPAARAARAAAARPRAERFGWQHAAGRAAERLEALAGRTPVRASCAAELPERRGTLFYVAADWTAPATWTAAVRAYVDTFTADDDVTLVLPGTPDGEALRLLAAELEEAGIDPAATADIALADPGPLGPHALELAADAVIAPGGRAWRSACAVPADAEALRSVLPLAEAA